MPVKHNTFNHAVLVGWCAVLISSSAAAQVRIQRVTDLSPSQNEVPYPTTLSQFFPSGTSFASGFPSGGGELVSKNMLVPGGGSIFTAMAHTHINAPDPASSGKREAFLFDNTLVTFDSLNRWAIDRGAMYIVNQRGRLEILKLGLARILASSELVVNVTPTAVDVYVVSGQVTVESLAVGTVAVLTAAMAAQATAGGVETVSLTAAQQAAFQQQVQTAQGVMNQGGLGSEAVVASAAAAGAIATVAILQGSEADLAVLLSADSDNVQVFQPITYLLEIRNDGPDTANEVLLVDNLPAAATLLSVQGAACSTGATVRCDLGSLSEGARIPIQIRVSSAAPGTLENVVSVEAKEKDPDSANNSGRLVTTVMSRPLCPGFAGKYRCATFDFLGGPAGIPNRLQPGLTLTCEGPANAPLRPGSLRTNFYSCSGDNSNFITVTGPLEGGRYVGRGFGSYTGLDGVLFRTEGEMITTFDSETCTLRDGQYRVGSDGSLPGGAPLSWRFECRQQ